MGERTRPFSDSTANECSWVVFFLCLAPLAGECKLDPNLSNRRYEAGKEMLRAGRKERLLGCL